STSSPAAPSTASSGNRIEPSSSITRRRGMPRSYLPLPGHARIAKESRSERGARLHSNGLGRCARHAARIGELRALGRGCMGGTQGGVARAGTRGAVEAERSAVLFDDAASDGNSEAGAAFFRRVVRLPDSIETLGRHARSAVNHAEDGGAVLAALGDFER